MSVTIFRNLTPASKNKRDGHIDQFHAIPAALAFGCTNPLNVKLVRITTSSNWTLSKITVTLSSGQKATSRTLGLSDEWACNIQL